MLQPVPQQLSITAPVPAARKNSPQAETLPEQRDQVTVGPAAPKSRRKKSSSLEEPVQSSAPAPKPPPTTLSMEEGVVGLERETFLATLPPERQKVHTGGWKGLEQTNLPTELLYSLGSDRLYMSNMFAMHFKEGGYLEVHQQMAGELAKQFAGQLDGTPFELIAGEKKVLKDVSDCYALGKLALDDEVLRNGDRLSQAEQEHIGSHVLLRTNRFPDGGDPKIEKLFIEHSDIRVDGARETIRHHHERWDGGGYPDGLKGHDIPLTAQILGVCDTWDALTTKRPWRVALDQPQARAAMQSLAEKGQFNPELVNVFLDKMASDPLTVENAKQARASAAEKLQGNYHWWVLRDAQDVEISLGEGYIDWESEQKRANMRPELPPDETELMAVHKMLAAPEANTSTVQEGLGYVAIGGVRVRRRI